MSGFISAPAAPASPAASTVAGDDFWPDIDVNAARKALRLGDSMVTHERLVAAIEGAMIAVMTDAAVWRARQEEAGATELADVDPDKEVNGQPFAVVLWQRAVRSFAAAELADAFTDLAATNEGVTRAQDKREVADDYRRQATVATSRLMDLGTRDPLESPRPGGIHVDLV